MTAFIHGPARVAARPKHQPSAVRQTAHGKDRRWGAGLKNDKGGPLGSPPSSSFAKRQKSALSVIAVDGKPNRLLPPASLSDVERTVFVDLITACDPKHFRPSDLPLLCRYCETAFWPNRRPWSCGGARLWTGKPSPWITVQEKAVRAMVALSMRLRLSPQSRIDPKTMGRQQQHEGPWPWDIRTRSGAATACSEPSPEVRSAVKVVAPVSPVVGMTGALGGQLLVRCVENHHVYGFNAPCTLV